MSVQTAATLDASQRETLYALGDVLIPASGELPSASAADPKHKWLDKALAARPDLVPTLAELLDRARGKDPGAEARRLHEEEPDGFSALSQIVSGAYFMNLKVRKRIGYPGQGNRKPFEDEADYDLRDDILDPVIDRGPIHKQPPGEPATNGKVEPLSFNLSRNGDRPNVLVIGAGAGGSVASRYLAEAGFSVVCLEQGPWPNPSEFPGDKLEWELVSDAQWSPNPNTRRQPADYPLEISEIPDHACHVQRGRRLHRPLLRPVGAHAAAGLPGTHRRRARRRLAHLLRGDEALLREDRPGHADLRHDRRPDVSGRARPRLAAAARSARSVARRPSG